MISVEPGDIPIKDLARLRQWLEDDRAQLFLACLRAEEAEILAKALQKTQEQSADVCRGGPLPLTALAEFKRAATIRSAINLIDEKMQDNSRLITASVSIT